jgi:hypothetical protein
VVSCIYYLYIYIVCGFAAAAQRGRPRSVTLRKTARNQKNPPTQYTIPPKRAQALIFQQKPALLPQKDVDRGGRPCYTDFTCRQTGLFSCAHSRGSIRRAALQGGK